MADNQNKADDDDRDNSDDDGHGDNEETNQTIPV